MAGELSLISPWRFISPEKDQLAGALRHLRWWEQSAFRDPAQGAR
jgi:hypothetical protein